MVESRWAELGGKELRFAGHAWELTGVVEVKGTGAVLEVEARQADDVRHGRATLRFNLRNPPASLNPGSLGDHFDSLEREDDTYYLVIKTESRIYRYELESIERR